MIFSMNKRVQWYFIKIVYFLEAIEINICVKTYLDQEEGDAICPQRPCQFDIFHFCFDLCHFSTVFVFLQVGLYMYSAIGAQLSNEFNVKQLICKFSKKTMWTHLEYLLLSSSLLDVFFG